MENVTLEEIFIGKADGMQESKRKDFIELFYEGNNSYYELANDESKFIISGRKGTGKTILAKYYEKRVEKAGGVTNTINGNDLLLSHIKEIGDDDVKDVQIAAFAKYTLLLELAKIIVDKRNKVMLRASLFKKRKCKKAIHMLEEIVMCRTLEGNYSISDFSTEESIDASVQVSVPPMKSGMSAKEIRHSSYIKNKYFALIESLEKNVMIVASGIKIALIVDDIDEYRNESYNNRNFYLFLTKIIEVSCEINESLYCANNKKWGKVILLLRSDFVDKLQAQNSNINKTITDAQILLNWISKIDDTHPEKNILMDLILTKIKHSNKKLIDISNDELYRQLFPEKINNSSSIKYIFNEGHGRPRDVINLLNIMKKENPKAAQFTQEMFISAKKEYSKRFRDEIKNEMSFYYSAEKIEECFRIIKLVNRPGFYISNVEAVIEQNRKQIMNIQNAEEFIDIAYDAGIIGNTWKDGNNRTYSFKYREDGDEQPNYQAKMIVHVGLRKNLLKI